MLKYYHILRNVWTTKCSKCFQQQKFYDPKITRVLIVSEIAGGEDQERTREKWNDLPDINSSLSSCLPSQAIALANSEVAKATNDSNKKKCGQYKKYHWNISLIQAILLIAQQWRGLKMWHCLPKCMHCHPYRKYAGSPWITDLPTYSGQVTWEGFCSTYFLNTTGH